MKTNNEGQIDKKKEKKSTLKGLICTNSGTGISPVYKRVYDKDLDRNIVKKVDTFNLHEFIQSSRSSTDLALLEKRYLELGEIPNYAPDAGAVDFTQLPSNIHEVYNMVNDVDANFNKLPDSIKQIFGTSQAYMQSLLDGTYQATLVKAIKDAQTPKEEAKEENK